MSTHPSSNTAEYQFTATQDWFSHNIEHWLTLFGLVKSSHPRVLEIGSWEGRSAVFLLNNLCKNGGEIVCIDHFDLFDTEAGKQRFEKINHNLALTGKRSRVLPQFSIPALLKLLEEETTSNNPGFDWIYIDGSHEADDTMLDGELSWRLARKGAIVIFDDYHWDKEPEDSIHHPKRGIDTFLSLHAGQYERLNKDEHYQVVLRKTTEMRIGFLVAGAEKHALNEALGYGMNIALAVDSAYAIGAAVTILSAIETTPERLTLYIVDCGLSSDDRRGLEEVVKGRDQVTIVFLELPSDSIAHKMGPSWAKIDMLEILPVERVLYLDADTLARKSLKPLWDTDLQGRSLGAVNDVGHPMGHEEIERRPYFNAGVLLVDLAKARLRLGELKNVSETMKGAKFSDQDALNVHFSCDWAVLGLQWNAQGLGTYAKYPSSDRDVLPLKNMENPSIVHFTGPVYPSVEEVLNPFVQPPTAKPWGYARAPGNPYCDEWWAVFKRTPWVGNVDFGPLDKEKIQNAIDTASIRFRDTLRDWCASKSISVD